jgi:predicted amidohydrolase YtcJ
MRITAFRTLLCTLLFIGACKNDTPANNSTDSNIATLYYGGDIITMEGDTPQYVEAAVVKEGKILFVGSKDEAMNVAGEGHKMIDLEGKTMLPGFIDGHAHFFGFGAQAVTANLLAEPDGQCGDIPQLIATMKNWTKNNDIKRVNGWIAGMGFDDAVLKENRFPTRQDLDLVSKDTPVVAVHISAHFCVMNTKGLELMGINAASKNPAGGIIRREKDGKTPNGVLEELAAMPLFSKILSPTTPENVIYFMEKGQEMAASFGHTTIQEGRAMGSMHKSIETFAKSGKLKLDVASYIDYSYPELMQTEWYGKEYKNHYRIAGLKLTLDGSPQGRTAWRTFPYLLPPDGQQKGYKGYPAIPSDDTVKAIIGNAYKNNWQILMHVNGDAAVDQLIKGLQFATSTYSGGDRRPVLIHGQFLRKDQLDSLKKYQVVASLFPMHTFYWGDWYTKIIGPDKANEISPVNTALKRGLKVTIHTDAPVALPNMMMILWTAVNRVSRSGAVIGAQEKLTPYQALQAITSWSAWQHYEEKTKGTLAKGKIADMVVLDQNPLKIEPVKLKDIKVVETIKDGNTVFKIK